MKQVLDAERCKPGFDTLREITPFEHEDLLAEDELEGIFNTDINRVSDE